MVQTRATTKRIDSGQELPQDIAIVAPRTKKPRADHGAESSRKKRRGKPGQLCQLNLDVLFLVRTLHWLSFRSCADGHDGATSWPHTFTP